MRSAETVIRLFRYEDAPKASYLISRCLNEVLTADFTHSQLEFFSRRFTAGGLRTLAAQCALFVAIRGDRVLGISALDGDRVKAVFVNPRFHRRGIGRLLMTRVEAEARQRKVSAVIACSNRSASGFYRRIGYRWVFRNSVFISL